MTVNPAHGDAVDVRSEVARILSACGIEPEGLDLRVRGRPRPTASPFRVAEAAVISTLSAVASVASFVADHGKPPAAEVDADHALMAFASERLLSAPGLSEGLWKPLTGNYACSDGWIRIHANLPRHDAAARRVLGSSEPRTILRQLDSDDVVDRITRAGGVAARLRTRAEWCLHPQQQVAAATDPPMATTIVPCSQDEHERKVAPSHVAPSSRPLNGLRVLDLCRVIAGPVAGRFLAAWGAEVIRVDGPNVEDQALLELDTGFGKRRATIDLTDRTGRESFDRLLSETDVLLSSFRPGTLGALQYDDDRLRAVRPDLIDARLSAWGSTGPWADRRGFDSVVQIATGLAHACGFDDRSGPGALPVQALDHASGYLLAAAVVGALQQRRDDGSGRRVDLALASTAEWLVSLGRRTAQAEAPLSGGPQHLQFTTVPGVGVVKHVAPIGRVGGWAASWTRAPSQRPPTGSTPWDPRSGSGRAPPELL